MTTAAEKQAMLRRLALEENAGLHPDLKAFVKDVNYYLKGRGAPGLPTTTTTSSTSSTSTTTPMP